jgi:hypothetical protein
VQTGHASRYVPKRPRQLDLTSIRKRRTLCNSHANILALPLSRRAFPAQLKVDSCRAERTNTVRIWRGIPIVSKGS